MVMILQKDIPILEAKATKDWTCPDNVFCSTGAEGLIVLCDTDPCLRGPGADHVPILTIIELPLPCINREATCNFRVADWGTFREDLKSHLLSILLPALLTTEAAFQDTVSHLTMALQDSIQAQVPPSKPSPESPHTKRWWSRPLSDLKKCKNRLSSLSYRYRVLQDHPSYEEHQKVHNCHSDEIWKAKLDHWNEFLEHAGTTDIWVANRYISGPGTDGGRSRTPLCSLAGRAPQRDQAWKPQ